MKKERSKWELVVEILKAIKVEEKSNKTRIMQRANLDWRNFHRHFDFLIEEKFIVKCNPENGCYKLTEKGGNLLQKLKEVDEVLGKGHRNL